MEIGPQGDKVVSLCKSIQQNSADLANLCAAGAGDTPQALELAKRVATDLGQLKEAIQTALVDKVVEDFMDVVTPLKVKSLQSCTVFIDGLKYFKSECMPNALNISCSNLLMSWFNQLLSQNNRHLSKIENSKKRLVNYHHSRMHAQELPRWLPLEPIREIRK